MGPLNGLVMHFVMRNVLGWFFFYNFCCYVKAKCNESILYIDLFICFVYFFFLKVSLQK